VRAARDICTAARATMGKIHETIAKALTLLSQKERSFDIVTKAFTRVKQEHINATTEATKVHQAVGTVDRITSEVRAKKSSTEPEKLKQLVELVKRTKEEQGHVSHIMKEIEEMVHEANQLYEERKKQNNG
jgi:hypothetical protein